MLKSVLGRLRAIGLLEGVSYLVLLGIAMPLKYFAGLPEAVRIFGMLHGLLFILYVLAIAHVTVVFRWSIVRVLQALSAAFIPFGNFVLDAKLRRDQLEILARSTEDISFKK